MKNLILASVVLLGSVCFVYSQGCIPVRSLVGFGQFARPEYDPLNAEPLKWVVNVNSRYYKSFQTFEGDSAVHESTQDQKVNHVFVVNFSITRILERGWSYTIDVPFISADRTSWQEHNPITKERHTTRAFGLGDIRFTVYKWMLDISQSHKGNIQFGLGLKLPTGNYGYQDFFNKPTGRTVAPVSPTIQPGDGGTGVSAEVNAFYTVNKTVSLYGNMFYLANPRDQNGVSNQFGGPPAVPGHPTIPASIVVEAGANVNSVPDGYTVRGGGNFAINHCVIWSGVRMEGVPVHDLIGSSNGQRRAGMIVSFEPGIDYKFKKATIYAFAPIPFYRTTYQTLPDKAMSQASGIHVASPGGFANYLIFIGAFFKIN